MTNLKDLIAAEKKRHENPTKDSVPVVLGGDKIVIEITKLHPSKWIALIEQHQPRPDVKADLNLGYNISALPAAYPVDHIAVDGQDVAPATWTEIYDLLASVHRNNVNTLMWGLNVYAATKELAELAEKRDAAESADTEGEK